MSNGEMDWSVLKGPILFFCSCLIVCSLLIGLSYYFSDKLSKELNTNKSHFQSISRRYLDVDHEEKILRQYLPDFVELYNKGVIGREKRLNWLEALRQSGEDTELPSLRYAINSQEEYTPEFEINYSGYTLYASSMELSLGLLHEGDFFNLLRNLDKIAEGIYTISECTFRRNGNQIRFEKNYANIYASCVLNWLTINLSNGQEIKI